MDPIGFSLENYNAIGVWRTNDSGFPIDPSGKMFDGSKLNGPASLRQAILNRSDVFLGTFAENLLSYGRGPRDRCETICRPSVRWLETRCS